MEGRSRVGDEITMPVGPMADSHPFLQRGCRCGAIEWGLVEFWSAAGQMMYPYACRVCGDRNF